MGVSHGAIKEQVRTNGKDGRLQALHTVSGEDTCPLLGNLCLILLFYEV